MARIEREFEIINKAGLHARAAALIVQTLSKYQSEAFLSKDSDRVNGKSIMGVMMLAAIKGSKVFVEIIGDDADAAMQELAELITNKFGEE